MNAFSLYIGTLVARGHVFASCCSPSARFKVSIMILWNGRKSLFHGCIGQLNVTNMSFISRSENDLAFEREGRWQRRLIAVHQRDLGGSAWASTVK